MLGAERYFWQAAATRKKRKIVFEDSDEEIQDIDADAYKKGLSAYKPSPEPEEKKGVQKPLLFVKSL